MVKFHNLLDAKFNPPRNLTLDTPLKFDSDTLSDEGSDLLKYCGVRVTNKNVVSGIGGFGAVYNINYGKYKKPFLVLV